MSQSTGHSPVQLLIRSLRQPAFLAVVILLAAAAVGLNAAVVRLQLSFKKLPVPLRQPLQDISPRLGSWLAISRDEPLDRELQDTLGTDKYIFRDYLDLSSHDGDSGLQYLVALNTSGEIPGDKFAATIDQFKSADLDGKAKLILDAVKEKTNTDRRDALFKVQSQYPDSVVNMAVTYYTGLVDTVAHIPDRCYIASGFEPTDYDFPNWTLSDGTVLPVRFINFQDQNGYVQFSRSVAYFFNVNGQWESNPLVVRQHLQNLFQRYGYYAKVELMTIDSDHQRSAKTMTDFLSNSLRAVQDALPDWKHYDSANGKSS